MSDAHATLQAAQAAFDAKQSAYNTARALRKSAQTLDELSVLLRSEQTHHVELRAARLALYRAQDAYENYEPMFS